MTEANLAGLYLSSRSSMGNKLYGATRYQAQFFMWLQFLMSLDFWLLFCTRLDGLVYLVTSGEGAFMYRNIYYILILKLHIIIL